RDRPPRRKDPPDRLRSAPSRRPAGRVSRADLGRSHGPRSRGEGQKSGPKKEDAGVRPAQVSGEEKIHKAAPPTHRHKIRKPAPSPQLTGFHVDICPLLVVFASRQTFFPCFWPKYYNPFTSHKSSMNPIDTSPFVRPAYSRY